MIQPRLSATWAYNGKDTVFASYARYNPAASSLPRAASWDRNLTTTIQTRTSTPTATCSRPEHVASSSGKLFVPDMTPPHDRRVPGRHGARSSTPPGRPRLLPLPQGHALLGRHQQQTRVVGRFTTRCPARTRIPQTLYIPDLTRPQPGASIGGSGSTYVIAELDGAFTKLQRGHARGRVPRAASRSSAARTPGATTTATSTRTTRRRPRNDANIFIGSSNIGDGPGRQLWDNKRRRPARRPAERCSRSTAPTTCRGTRSLGAFVVAQSGQPWEKWNYAPYSALTTVDERHDPVRRSRRARTAPTSHSQLDLNYTQNIPFAKRLQAQIAVDVFNVFNQQTGYNIEPRVHSSAFGQPQSFFDPRRDSQVAARLAVLTSRVAEARPLVSRRSSSARAR